ncbi:hypothetical protein NDU88_005297 [Pleurodeles waltl]|uniref:Uncharacterized protein n=1 Tax=Pleurodeles waltl TaxID=8319 RepID=A0AAV7LNP7_PLEWA|nr:hypothetical protein NDU88_005297 [Pleurodeles waltl]
MWGGGTPWCYMAAMMHPNGKADIILAVKDKNGHLINDLAGVMNRFIDYYTAFYTTKITLDADAISDYLTHITMPWLKNADREYLMASLQPGEVCCALKSMAMVNAPGPDEPSMAFYQTYQDLLIPHLMTLCEAMLRAREMLPSMRQTLITILFKVRKS